MKICFLAPANSIHSKRWISFFVDAGHDVEWISLHPSAFDENETLRYHEFDFVNDKTIGSLFGFTIRIRKVIKTFGPDVIHVHSAGTYGLFGLLCSGNTPMVLTAWGSDILFATRSLLKSFLVKMMLRKARLITTDAVHMKEEMQKLGADGRKIHQINFGVDGKRFSLLQKNQELRKELGLGDEPTVISMRSFEEVYDVETLIRAVPLVLEREPQAEFLLLGKGPLKEGLESLANELGVISQVHFLGHLPPDQLPSLLSSCDIYVSTSLSDAGLASCTQEAMASCIPVIITDSGENRNWVKNGINGLVIPVKAPKILAEKICYLIENEGFGVEMGVKARETILDLSDYYKEMRKMERLLKATV